MSHQKKIIFKISSEETESIEVESVWATIHKEGYVVDNIPFYAQGVAFGDVMSVENVDGSLYADELLSPSGHSTIRLWFASKEDVPKTRQELSAMGCGSEVSDSPRLVAIDIPPSVNYESVKKYFEKGESKGIWDYEEACLGFL